jgi:hypothetical protein
MHDKAPLSEVTYNPNLTILYKNQAQLTLLALFPPNATNGKELEQGREDFTGPANSSTNNVQNQRLNVHDLYQSRPHRATWWGRHGNVCAVEWVQIIHGGSTAHAQRSRSSWGRRHEWGREIE